MPLSSFNLPGTEREWLPGYRHAGRRTPGIDRGLTGFEKAWVADPDVFEEKETGAAWQVAYKTVPAVAPTQRLDNLDTQYLPYTYHMVIIKIPNGGLS